MQVKAEVCAENALSPLQGLDEVSISSVALVRPKKEKIEGGVKEEPKIDPHEDDDGPLCLIMFHIVLIMATAVVMMVVIFRVAKMMMMP